MAPDVSIIIPVWNQWALTQRCLETLFAYTDGQRIEVIVVNNGSTDETVQGLDHANTPLVIHTNEHNLGFARACNQGAALAKAPVLLFLNNDTELHAGWLPPLLQALDAHPRAAMVGNLLLFPNGRIQHAGVALAYGLGYPLSAYHVLEGEPCEAAPKQLQTCSAVTAACVAVRAAVFRHLRGFDEGYINGYEDIDLCLRARAAGHEVLFEPRSVITHVTSATLGRFAHEQHNIDRLHAQWLGRVDQFDKDLRHDLRAATPRAKADRSPLTVVSLVLPGALPTLAAWMETTKATLGAQDAWMIVNAGADLTSQNYAAWMAKQANAQWLSAPQDTEAAWHAALAQLETDLVALSPPNCVPSWHWLDRAVAHLQSDPTLAVVAAGLPPMGTTGAVTDDLDLSVMEHALGPIVQGRRETTGVPETMCFVARGNCVKAAGLLPAAIHEFGPRLAQLGLSLATAWDMYARRLAAPARPAHTLESARQVLLGQAANLASAAGANDAVISSQFGKAPRREKVSIVVPVFNQAPLTHAFLQALYAHTPHDFEVILVDNGSGPEVAEVANTFARQHGNLSCVRNERNEGFAYACNQGLDRCQGAYAVVINNDVLVPAGWLQRLLSVFESDSSIGVVGPMTNRCVGIQQVQPAPYADAKQFAIAAAARALTHRGGVLNVGRLVGLCLLIKTEVIKRIGGFDPIFGYGNFEDDDFCLRARRAGFRLAVAEDVLLHHEGSSTFTGAGFDARALAQQNWEIFCHKWRHDPEANQFSQVEALANSAPFDADADVVPTDFQRQFHPNIAALPLNTDKRLRLLMVPDLGNTMWLAVVQTYLEAFTATSPVALVLRPHPPTPERAHSLVQAVSALLNQLPMPQSAPQIILEASWLCPQAQARLYAAMSAWLRTPGPHEPFVARECAAMGLPTLYPAKADLLAFVNSHTGRPVAPMGDHA